jgi:hypothetical protein
VSFSALPEESIYAFVVVSTFVSRCIPTIGFGRLDDSVQCS